MIKKFIKGSSTNPEGVIKALEKLGGRNEHNLTGRMSNIYYFIDDKGVIDAIAPSDTAFCILTECFEEIQPVDSKPVPKVITNLDVSKWYFHMLRDGHAVQFMYCDSRIRFRPSDYLYDDGKTTLEKVRIDFGEWMTIEEAGIDKIRKRLPSRSSQNKIVEMF